MVALLSIAWIANSTAPLSAQTTEATDPLSKEHVNFFESKVRPLLIDHCYECHSRDSDESAGGLLLDSAAAVLRGGDHGPVLVKSDPDNSLLIRAITYQDADLQMPPDGKLDDSSIEVLRHWIAIGAPDPRQEQSEPATKPMSPIERDPLTHWAFHTPQQASMEWSAGFPNDATARDLIDALAHKHAAEKGIKPNVEAGKETLIRRLYFDLTGLPPSQGAIERFQNSQRPDAYVRLVDSLLATPAFGERFGRHWMDVARYADTVGYALAGQTRRYTGSERFRDWAIRAFAGDMPYDEMLRHQLAGDRTDPNNDNGNLDAMGFLTLGRKFLNPLDTIDDRIDVVTRGLLGMTVSCARCHDHKFDPIPTSDYYSLAGIIFSSDQPKEGASPLMMVDKENPTDSPVLIRGQIGNRGPIAPRQFLTALRKKDEPRFTDGSGRWELVQRITDSDNPLTSRVMVNRLWSNLIGKPLVDSPSDFGFRTNPPAIPELLDDLANEFSQHWSIKRIVRRIVLSSIYRQSSAINPATVEADPENQLLTRANRKRQDFESLRDSILAVAGVLDRSLGGEPVEITLDTLSPRRTVYAMIDRQNLPSLFRTFDFASPDAHSPGRYFTTVPQQALHLLNSPQVLDLASRTARTVRADAGATDADLLAAAMFRRILSRDPNDREREAAIRFLSQDATPPPPPIDARGLWSYGTATIADNGQPIDFQPFAVFTENRWQAEADFPSRGSMGHAYLGKETGHTANDPKTAVVRRFTAPFAGEVQLIGTMGHRNDQGDGIKASFWIGNQRIFDEVQKSNDRPYGPLDGRVEKGQTIDFVALPGESSSFDTFYWNVRVKISGADRGILETDSIKHFSGPYDAETARPLDRLAQLAQTLLMSNEFAFVD